MAGSSNQWAYGLGSTNVAIIAGATGQLISPPRACNGFMLKYISGGSLAIVPGIGSSGTPLGWLVQEVINIDGPATFFMNAGGATAVAQIIWKYSSGGLSLTP